MNDPTAERLRKTLEGAYTIEGEIGRGGMGVVYHARDERLKRRVAIKVLPPELAFRDEIRLRFLREAETAARLSHPHIVPIHSVGEGPDGLTYFVMAYVDGEPLGARLKRRGPLPHEEARRIIGETADALGAAHAVGIVHRRTPHLGAKVELHNEVTALPPVAANLELIEWVFENLLKNAVDATADGGQIWVRSDLAGSTVQIRVADSGRGIPHGRRNAIWEPGFSTKDRGWGLGLTLVRRIVVEYHSGQIWVEDNEDHRGICFVMQLPVTYAPTRKK
jgi:signal transduction histidine kinase